MPHRPFLSLFGLAVLGSLVSCTGPVELEAFTPANGTKSVCAALMDDLPVTVMEQPLRKVEPPSAGSAWGDPAIVLQCGVAKPDDLKATSRCDDVDGVGWFESDSGDDSITLTTIGRKAYVRVRVPRDYDPAADALTELAPAIKRHNPVERPCV